MDIGQLLSAAFRNPSVIVLYLCLIFSVAAFAIGSLRAKANGSFLSGLWSSWVGTDGPKIGVILVLLLLGNGVMAVKVDTDVIPIPSELAGAGIIGIAILQGVTFIVSKWASIAASLNPPAAAASLVKAEVAADRANDPLPEG